jgi:hypothetical protein
MSSIASVATRPPLSSATENGGTSLAMYWIMIDGTGAIRGAPISSSLPDGGVSGSR